MPISLGKFGGQLSPPLPPQLPQPNDPVNPAHYKGDYVMRIIEDFELTFVDGTIIKYILRAGRKPNESALQDYKKALWYLQRKISNLEK